MIPPMADSYEILQCPEDTCALHFVFSDGNHTLCVAAMSAEGAARFADNIKGALYQRAVTCDPAMRMRPPRDEQA